MAVQALKFACLLLLSIIMYCDVQGVTINDTRLSAVCHDYITLPQGVGTVEVFVDQYNTWFPVCSTTSWDNSAESKVLCRQLGFNATNNPATDRALQLSNRLSLDFDFKCSGSESELTECSYQVLYKHTSCYPIIVSCLPCREGSVWLYNVSSSEEGVIEYCRGGFWRAVCDTNWSYQNSFVVCRQLGLPATAALPHLSMYHPFPIGVYFNCFGNESSLADCRATGTPLCNFENIAGVQCAGKMVAGCIDGDTRLIGGRQSEKFSEGRVEICSNGVWGTIYDGGSWDRHDAIVVCRQLGYQMAIPYRGGLLGSGSGPILYAYLNCTGNETSLSQCSTLQSNPFGIGHFSDAGVRCLNASHSNCSDGDVRLVNGTTMFEGRVEICYRGIWGSVCDDVTWDSRDAATLCRQLGFPDDNVRVVSGSFFGDGEGPYLWSSTRCGQAVNNNYLPYYCTYGYVRGIRDYTSECSPGHNAGVICEACSRGEVRLVEYKRVEVCIDGIWAGICSDTINASAVARTLCKQLFGVEKSFHTETCSTSLRYVKATSILHDVSCNEQSRNVVYDCSFSISSRLTAECSDCSFNGSSQSTAECSSALDIVCFHHSNCTEGAVRLADGESPLDGRFEVCVNGSWGVLPAPVSSSIDGYPSTELEKAERICRQFGLPWEWATPLRISGDYPHVLNYISDGGEHRYRSSCSRGSAFGVLCQGNSSKPKECKHLDVRLVNGSKKTEGRLELCAYGYWSNVCNDYSPSLSYLLEIQSAWPWKAPILVCHKLGFPTEVLLYKSSGTPFGSSPLMLPSVGIRCHELRSASYSIKYGIKDISDCQIINQSNFCPVKDRIGISCGEREKYRVTVEIDPAQESYDIGTEVTLRCILPSSLLSSPFITIDWRTTVPDVLPYVYPLRYGFDRSNISFVIPAHHPISANYYCSVRGVEYPLTELATERTTLKIKDVLQRSIIDEHIQVQEQSSVHLQVETLNINVTRLLSELTWYHNGTVILPGRDARITFSTDNKTLTIVNFSSTDAGVYKAQFNKISVQPYNHSCNDKLIPLLRSYPILAPVVYCINVNSCTSEDSAALQVQRVNVRQLNFDLSDGLMLVADGIANSTKELEHLSFKWYRNGRYIYTPVYSSLRQYPTISQELKTYSEVAYEETGRYEVALTIFVNDPESTCQAYYGQFLAPYYSYSTNNNYEVPLSWGFIDVSYYKNVDFNLDTDKNATTSDEGAILTCRASIDFPPFSMLSLIKNGQTVATSSSGMLQINTKSVGANPFGLYICQLNASGEIFEESTFLKEQVSIRIKIEMDSQRVCDYSAESIEQGLISKISTECRCNFSRDDFSSSSVDCEDSSTLIYRSTIEYSNDEGSETASVIANRLTSQTPFSLMVEGMPVTVTTVAVDCDDCRSSLLQSADILSPAAVSGLFVGGFVTGALIVFIIIVMATVIIIGVRKYHRSSAKDETKPCVNDNANKHECSHAAQSVPTLTENDKEKEC